MLCISFCQISNLNPKIQNNLPQINFLNNLTIKLKFASKIYSNSLRPLDERPNDSKLESYILEWNGMEHLVLIYVCVCTSDVVVVHCVTYCISLDLI